MWVVVNLKWIFESTREFATASNELHCTVYPWGVPFSEHFPFPVGDQRSRGRVTSNSTPQGCHTWPTVVLTAFSFRCHFHFLEWNCLMSMKKKMNKFELQITVQFVQCINRCATVQTAGFGFGATLRWCTAVYRYCIHNLIRMTYLIDGGPILDETFGFLSNF